MRGYIPLSMVLTCRARRDPHRSILAASMQDIVGDLPTNDEDGGRDRRG